MGEIHSRPARQSLDEPIEFIGDFDVVRATGIDLSVGGICFEVHRPLGFEMRFEADGAIRQERAELVWLRRLPDGGYRLGLRFVTPETPPVA
jgi:hypothetical protein